MRIPLDELQLCGHIPLPLRPILPAISLRIGHLDPLSPTPKMLQLGHRTAIGTEAWSWSWTGVVRAVGAVGREGESICTAVGRWRSVGVARVDHLMESVDVVAVTGEEEVAFTGVIFGIGRVGRAYLWMLRVDILCGWDVLHVWVLVWEVYGLRMRGLHILMLEIGILHSLSLRVGTLHVLVLHVLVLHVQILRIRGLLLGLSLIGLCLGGLSPHKIFLLRLGGAVVRFGNVTVARYESGKC